MKKKETLGMLYVGFALTAMGVMEWYLYVTQGYFNWRGMIVKGNNAKYSAIIFFIIGFIQLLVSLSEVSKNKEEYVGNITQAIKIVSLSTVAIAIPLFVLYLLLRIFM